LTLLLKHYEKVLDILHVISEFDSRSWQDVLDTTLCDFLLPLKEKFEDAKKSIRNRKSKKDRQYNDQKTQGTTMLNQKLTYFEI
jgi:hypothetical protein